MNAGDVKRARGFQPGVGAVHAAQSEVHDLPAPCSLDHARRLGGEDGLQMDLVHHERLDELRLGNRRLDFDEGLVREHRCPFRDGVDVARESKLLQMLEERLREAPERVQIGEGRLVEAERLEKRQHIVQPARQQVVPPLGQTPHEEAEHGDLTHLLLEIGLEHGELVQVREQSGAELRLRHD